MKNILENYLYEHIPISQSMGITVTEASVHEVILHAPISNNINHKKTVFGGSLHAVSTLACWGLLYINLKEHCPASEIVITHSDVDYLIPVTSDFDARCIMPSESNWMRFTKMLQQKNKARIQLVSEIFVNQKIAVRYQGIFAVLKQQKL